VDDNHLSDGAYEARAAEQIKDIGRGLLWTVLPLFLLGVLITYFFF
jgi:hypothetical protein